MTQEEKQKYAGMVSEAFDYDGNITRDGRALMAATFYSVDKLGEQLNDVKNILREITK
jgi:hypothetical protein